MDHQPDPQPHQPTEEVALSKPNQTVTFHFRSSAQPRQPRCSVVDIILKTQHLALINHISLDQEVVELVFKGSKERKDEWIRGQGRGTQPVSRDET